MLKYQIGTALVSGRATIVLYCQETYLDLHALLESSQVKQAFSLDRVDIPTSLMQMLEQWRYWKEQLPQIVEHVFAQGSANKLADRLDAAALRWLPPLMYPRKLICIGTNYWEHIAEMSGGTGKPPARPYSFFKPPTTTLIGSGTPFTLPEYARMIDWEVELAVVIGQRAYNVRGDAAMACIAGYSVFNDISARDWNAQPTRVGIDWVMGKAANGAAPMGPFITPVAFVEDPQNLRLTLTVNGQLKQNSSTTDMVFGVREIVEHLASIMTLEPGDVIATGTPAGVGYGRKPPELLKSGDYMIAEVEGLGRLETPVQ
jgi:2-keto-4-pentenoate hydratase/2-oxohepta-3-ene-1,7-dioic acid hydratase in catechol pathway